MSREIQGRPRLPEFDPDDTPPKHNLAAWERIVTDKRTGLYAAETLLRVYDAALSADATMLATLLHKAVWDAGKRYINHLSWQFGLKQLFAEPVVARAQDYLRVAIERKTYEDGSPFPNHANIRGGFFRFVGNRFIDAYRCEDRVLKQDVREAARAAKRRGKTVAVLNDALTGYVLEGLASYESKTNQELVRYLLREGPRWKDVALAVDLASADAARKRFSRLVARLRRKESE